MTIVTLALLALSHTATSLIALPPHLSSGAILQTWRGYHIATHLYGTATPGELVTVSCSVPHVPPFTALADAAGEWGLAYNWPPGPTEWNNFDLTFTGTDTPSPILLAGVRWGDVVLCVGDGGALLPLSLSDGAEAWASSHAISTALASVRLFAAPVAGSCEWGGAGQQQPCGAWRNATALPSALGFSAACLRTAVEATLAPGFNGNRALGVIQLAANESSVEAWTPPPGLPALASCAPLPGGPPSPGALWAAAGAFLANTPFRYFMVALGATDARRLLAPGGLDAAAAATAYACRLSALAQGLRAGAHVGDAPLLLLEPLPGAVLRSGGNGEALFALRLAAAAALPADPSGARPLGSPGLPAATLAVGVDAGSGGAVNAGGGVAGTNVSGIASRGAAALAYTAWWAFSEPGQGPTPRAATRSAQGASIAFAFAPGGSGNGTLGLLASPGCTACCATPSAAFQWSASSAGPWQNARPLLSGDRRALLLELPGGAGSAPWLRGGAAAPGAPECLLVDAATGLPAPAFLLRTGGGPAAPPPLRAARTALPPTAPLLPAPAPLASGIAARRAYLLGAAARAAAAAALPAPLQTTTLAAVPPMYWNSWQAFRCNLNERLLLAVGEALVSTGLAAAGWRTVSMDDCEWRTLRSNATGKVVPDETRFPSGMPALAARLSALSPPIGLGVYTSQTASTCVGRPGTFEHEELDAATWCEWGARLAKVDNCGGARWPAANTSWIKLRAALDACPAPVLLSVESCGVPAGGSGANPSCAAWIRSVGAQMFRTTADLQLYWESVVFNLDGNEPMAPLAGPGVWPDPDMLIVGHPGLSPAETQSHYCAWVIAAAPLGLSLDLTGDVAPATLNLLLNPEVLAVNQDAAGVAGVRATAANATGAECWAKPLSGGGGNTTAVLLFNRAGGVGDVACAWADVAPHVPASAKGRVRDLVGRKDLGVFEGGFVAAGLPAHGSMLVSVAF